jgi:MlaD protein
MLSSRMITRRRRPGPESRRRRRATGRGLSSEASVEFRGIRVGSVVGASFKYFPGDLEHRVPVLIKIDPDLLLDQTGSYTATAQALIAQSVEKGLRASLKSGSLLTGQLFVDLDFQKDAPPATVRPQLKFSIKELFAHGMLDVAVYDRLQSAIAFSTWLILSNVVYTKQGIF